MISKKEAVRYIITFSLAAALLAVALTVTIGRMAQRYALSDPSAARSLENVDTLINVIEEKFIAPVDKDALYVNAQKGMVAGLGDVYSTFYTREEYQKLTEQRSGAYQGIGILISLRQEDSALEILEVYPDTPAEKAGLKAHDVLLEIGGQSTEGLGVEDAAALVRASGDGMLILVERGGEEMRFIVTSETVVVPQTEWRMLQSEGHKVGYIKIKQFMGDALEGFNRALDELKGDGMEALIVDVRNNPGGDLQLVVDIADKLLPDGVILTERARSGEEKVFNSDAECVNLPMAVLANSYSASASEILAGAVQDYGVGKIVGVRTYGKGVVQTIYPLSSGDYVKLTTAAYFTPNGRSVHGVGVTPDVEAELPEALKTVSLSELEEKDDTQLQAAIASLAF